MTLEEMKKIAAARTKGDWSVVSDLPKYAIACNRTDICTTINRAYRVEDTSRPDGLKEENARFIAMAANHFEKLLAVVEAVKDDAITWNEELCDSQQHDQMWAAIGKLRAAIKALENE